MQQLRLRGNTPDTTPTTSTSATKCTSNRHAQKTHLIEELKEIQDTTEARIYLEKTELIVPPGQPISPGTLSTAIHHVTNYKGLPKPAINALRAIAFLMDELEENAIHEVIQNSVTTQLNELSNNLNGFLNDATQQINKAVTNNISAIAFLMEDGYTDQLTATVSDNLQQKLDNILVPHTQKLATLDLGNNSCFNQLTDNIKDVITTKSDS